MSSSWITSLLMVLVLLWTFAGTAQEAVDPSTEILRDKYILGLSKALKADDYPKALAFIEKLDELGVDLPPAIDYFRGEAYFHTERYDEANRALNRYVAKTGREGRYYQQSLELMLVAEEHAAAERQLRREQEAQERARREAENAERQRREREAQERARREAEQRREREKAEEIARRELEKLGRTMVRVDGGSFVMGCQRRRDGKCFDYEKPTRRVQVGSFEIGKYEVTRALWEAVMGERGPSYYDSSECPQCPVDDVYWGAVRKFLTKLNTRTGRRYRLPSEAEWEYAARGGQRSRGYQYAGSNNLDLVAWHKGNSGPNVVHPVGGKQANELGLHDMSGNVLEWVQDCWNDSHRGGPRDGGARKTECKRHRSGVYRAARGGASGSRPVELRSAARFFDRCSRFRCYAAGFRIARTLTP